jgi:lipopolysaccharide/colanic/teichoic acid biosynthesis glycosyltransferase
MAIVGPRPIPVALDIELRLKIPGFEERYSVAPGLTSIGQICVRDNALGEKLIEDWKLRFEGELHYLRNRCFRYDLIMITMTILYVFRKSINK